MSVSSLIKKKMQHVQYKAFLVSVSSSSTDQQLNISDAPETERPEIVSQTALTSHTFHDSLEDDSTFAKFESIFCEVKVRHSRLCCFNRGFNAKTKTKKSSLNSFLLTRGYPSSALTCRTRYAVPAGELHVWELGYVLPSAEPIQRLIIGIPVLSLPLRALPLRDE